MATQIQSELNTHVRWMIRRDMPEVLDIEYSNSRGWTENDFLTYLRQKNCIGMVIENKNNNEILGYMVYELNKYSLGILNFSVHPKYRNKKIGKTLIEKLKNKLNSHKRTLLTTTIRETNLDFQLFLKQMGFMATHVERRFFEDTNEDAYVMEYKSSFIRD